ncbi:hypothetical protein POM88_045542 [Heracleum sosnowskyi]|uniref:Uncharacterized protein n=1 Tax=Heracleum sosnowskyi TaxID=360622 RepID=A0AAD8M6I2_9APIA|nr:hypothetical protein POM88_045542 [Heracleum sosnowskyi]
MVTNLDKVKAAGFLAAGLDPVKVLTTKSRQVDESVSTKGKTKINDDALQNEVSNASSSHIERVFIRDPSNFFVDLRIFKNDYSIDYNDEEENRKDKEDEDEDKDENDGENDELSDNDDLV